MRNAICEMRFAKSEMLRFVKCDLRNAIFEMRFAKCDLRKAKCDLPIAKSEMLFVKCDLGKAKRDLRIRIFRKRSAIRDLRNAKRIHYVKQNAQKSHDKSKTRVSFSATVPNTCCHKYRACTVKMGVRIVEAAASLLLVLWSNYSWIAVPFLTLLLAAAVASFISYRRNQRNLRRKKRNCMVSVWQSAVEA